MIKYIALLRGINVGNIRIKMTDLKASFEKMGYQNVATVLQTGNVVFESDQEIQDIKNTLESGLSETFHYKAYVLVYEHEYLADVIAQYPMTKDENHHAYIVFIENSDVFEELSALAANIGTEATQIAQGKQLLYWKVPIGDTLGTSFAKILAKPKYKSTTTTRNINTLGKL